MTVAYDPTTDNQYWLFIFEPLQELTRTEFPTIDIGVIHEGEQSFVFRDISNDLVESDYRGENRTYQIEVVYDYAGGDVLDSNTRKRLSNISERFKRMVHNYRDFSVEVHWVDEGGTWGNTTHTWGSDESTYCWDMGRIESINQNQENFEAEEGHYRVSMLFQCERQEVVRES